jgi:carbamoylphosphate synthase large subunit
VPSEYAFLVSAAGGPTGFSTVRTIRAIWGDRATIVTTDIFPRHLIATPLFADMHFVGPLASDPAWDEFIVETIKDNNIGIAIPILDREIANLAQLSEERAIGCCIAVCPSPKATGICNDKWRCGETLLAAGIAVPPFARAAPNCLREGWLLKAREGAGTGVVRIDAGNIAHALDGIAPERYMLQLAFAGREVTVDAFVPRRGGETRAICRERIETKAGVCSKARLFHDDSILEIARAIGTVVGLTGAFCFQIIESEQGAEDWAVIDVNPRTGGGTAMSGTVGFDVIGANLLDALGLDYAYRLQPLSGEHFVVRQPEDYVTLGRN